MENTARWTEYAGTREPVASCPFPPIEPDLSIILDRSAQGVEFYRFDPVDNFLQVFRPIEILFIHMNEL